MRHDTSGYILLNSNTFREFMEEMSPETFGVMMHLLLCAKTNSKGVLSRGQVGITEKDLAEETGLSLMNVTNALHTLKKAGEISVEKQEKYIIITLLHFDDSPYWIIDEESA